MIGTIIMIVTFLVGFTIYAGIYYIHDDYQIYTKLRDKSISPKSSPNHTYTIVGNKIIISYSFIKSFIKRHKNLIYIDDNDLIRAMDETKPPKEAFILIPDKYIGWVRYSHFVNKNKRTLNLSQIYSKRDFDELIRKINNEEL